MKIAEEHGYNFTMMRGVIDKIATAAGRGPDRRQPDALAGITVGSLGLTFKAGTDDLRESPALAIISELRRLGARVVAYDPTVVGELSPHQEGRDKDARSGARPLAAQSRRRPSPARVRWFQATSRRPRP